jgi:Fe-S cluster biogenesis protein NfuA
MRDKIEAILQKLRLQLAVDGGDVQLMEVTDDGVVKLRFVGKCCWCPFSLMALKAGLESSIKEAAPDVRRVETVTVRA